MLQSPIWFQTDPLPKIPPRWPRARKRDSLRLVKVLIALVALALAASSIRADVDPALREDGVLYYADNLPNRIIATVKVPTTVFLRRDFSSPLASVFAGQKIEIVGAAPEGYLITCVYRNNSVSGWITPDNLPPDVDRGLLAQAQKAQARRNQMARFIANKQVVRGMTPDEVQQSLGKPDQTSSRTDADGTLQTWTFTVYQTIWQTSYTPGFYGRGVAQTYPVKTPVGQTIVTFTDGVVSAIEQNKTSTASAGINSYP
jgi:hypothetical protein